MYIYMQAKSSTTYGGKRIFFHSCHIIFTVSLQKQIASLTSATLHICAAPEAKRALHPDVFHSLLLNTPLHCLLMG